jgi:hypothetical protein
MTTVDPSVTRRFWKPISSVESTSVALGIDFPTTGRREAGFAELAAHTRTDCALWQSVPPSIPPDTPISAEEYLALWLAEIRASGATVRAVLGYCVGAVHAAVLAERIGEWQEPPRIVAFDPEMANVTTLHRHFGKVLASLSGVLGPEEAAAARKRADGLLTEHGGTEHGGTEHGGTEHGGTEHGGSVRGFAIALCALFGDVAEPVFARVGLDAQARAEITGLFGGYLTFLTIAERLDPSTGWLRSSVISSASPTSGLNRLRAAGERVELGPMVREYQFDVDHPDLLRSPEVARTVERLLEK